MLLELDLFAVQIINCARGVRSYNVVLVDKTLPRAGMYYKKLSPQGRFLQRQRGVIGKALCSTQQQSWSV